MDKKPNILQQLLWNIIKPHKLFEQVKEKPLIVLPIILMIFAGIFLGISSYNATANIDYSKIGGISPQQADLTNQMMKSPIMGAFTVLIAVGKNIFSLFLKGLIMWGLIYIVGGRGSYMKSVSVVGLSWFPLFIRDCLKAIIGAGANVDQQMASMDLSKYTFNQLAVSSFSQEGILFILWNIVLLTIGFSIVFNVPKVKAALVSSLYWVVGFLGSLGAGWASIQSAIRMQKMMP